SPSAQKQAAMLARDCFAAAGVDAVVNGESPDLREGFDVVAWCGDHETLRSLRRSLAGHRGPIVTLVSERIYPAAYAHERSVCVDTTAAGGNATLLAEAG
ncbi:MAG: hypothetical protein KDM63_21890, partial [Verrucomicrobiae bacterium]|nr:hypothetical protein [Verrucomicrobiae bacterium]